MITQRSVKQFVSWERNTTERYFDLPNQFQYRQDRPLRWLQRILFSILGWIEAYAKGVESTSSYEEITIKCHSIASLIHHAYWSFEQKTGERPTHILLGYEQREEIMMGQHMVYEPQRLDARDTILGMIVIYDPAYKGQPIVFKA